MDDTSMIPAQDNMYKQECKRKQQLYNLTTVPQNSEVLAQDNMYKEECKRKQQLYNLTTVPQNSEVQALEKKKCRAARASTVLENKHPKTQKTDTNFQTVPQNTQFKERNFVQKQWDASQNKSAKRIKGM